MASSKDLKTLNFQSMSGSVMHIARLDGELVPVRKLMKWKIINPYVGMEFPKPSFDLTWACHEGRVTLVNVRLNPLRWHQRLWKFITQKIFRMQSVLVEERTFTFNKKFTLPVEGNTQYEKGNSNETKEK